MKLGKLILCLDVAFAHLGVAVFNTRLDDFIYSDVIDTEREVKQRKCYVIEDSSRRCAEIANSLMNVLQRFHPQKPSLVIAELPHGSQNAKVSMAMGMALGTVATFCAVRQLDFMPIHQLESKRIVDPKRKDVSKEEIQRFVEGIYGSKMLPKTKKREHVADAMLLIELLRVKAPDKLT